ncbi:uncharacterized protein LOC107223627 isoform X1 [Neodiprion lecontei]|uniref:Uncharacterized protein LOC107223627 isoform X1 n=1 Tax=Neodiprion lecontei TaxID=441921 RepID=A0ABM3FDA5_NEOLC|nr:uncharacterized protein LOC107223627 isoform X1 [Neodiprion lecontei]XP_046585998.1 uncharacterized protein LOC107223627 isoform X1 [Neodiprion lecontei]XP_046585999.1 uncharacterized protein LOC107223627 isoform X1 [Neodiprion lecontei]XP_046586000.1 uncharacterized protein LOC107223627 isoform X1 [Neodiprion lecontei]
MEMLRIIFNSIFFAHLTPVIICVTSPSLPSTDSNEVLEEALTNFKMEVKSAIVEAQTAITEFENLFGNLEISAMTLQKNNSDIVNDTLTLFGKQMNTLLMADNGIDVNECAALGFSVESRAIEILLDTNTCVHKKLERTERYTEATISSLRCEIGRLNSLVNIAEDIFTDAMESKEVKAVPQALDFLKSAQHFFQASFESRAFAERTFSTLSDAASIFFQINSHMIANCGFAATIFCFIDDAQIALSEIEACITDVNSIDGNFSGIQ